MADEFREKLAAFATRAIQMSPRCTNEESTRLFLILPFLNALGYDDRNPDEVCPEHNADFSEKYKNRVDFAILQNNSPVIAIECKCCDTALKDERGQLRSYFNAAPTVKMGVLTDGLLYEFYADSDEPNMMDQNAFLVVNLREIAKGKIEESVLDGLRGLQKNTFDPENIGAEAKRKLVFQNVLQQLNQLAENPSEAFTRLLLQNAGLSHVRTKALAEYQDLIRSAFRELINLRILKRLDLPTNEAGPVEVAPVEPSSVKAEDRIVTTATELTVLNYAKRRLAFLVKDEALFGEIEQITYRDYQGKFVAYYRKERKGRLFDFVEGESPKYKFYFSGGEEVLTNKLAGNRQAPLGCLPEAC